jgi:MFS family permease
VPLGLPHFPQPGEVFASPPLADLLHELPADRLADRFPSAPSGTIGRDFLAGPDDLVAVVGVTPEAAEAMGAQSVVAVNTKPQEFGFTDFLRLVFAIGAVGLILPVLVFVSTSTRLGAARREQRFAAMRLAGATPRQTNLVAAVEAGAAAAIGAVAGALGFFALRPQVAKITIDSHPPFVEDVRIPPALLVAVLLLVPMLAVAASMVSLRRLQISPLGVARRSVRPRPTARRLVPLVVGGIGFVLAVAVGVHGRGWSVILPIVVTFSLVIYGIVVAGPWLTVLTARLIGRLGRRPASLLAGRRLEDDPTTGFRAVSGLVLAVFVASVFAGSTAAVVAEGGTPKPGLVAPSTIVAPLPDPSTAPAALAAASAAGAGKGIVAHRDPQQQADAHGVTTLLVACGDLDVLALDDGCQGVARVEVLPFVRDSTGGDGMVATPTSFTLDELAAMPAEYVAVLTDGRPSSTDRIRTAIQQAAPGAAPWLGSEASTRDNSRITQLSRLANLALAVSLVIAGCGLAVAVAGGIIERKRPFALLRLSGMHLRELQRVALLEAAAPLVLIALASAVLGLAVSAVVVGIAGGVAWEVPSVGYWLSLAGGLLVALGVAAASLPLLGRVTVPSAVRFE